MPSARPCVLLSHVPCSKPNQLLRRVLELDGDPPEFGPFFARNRRATLGGSGTGFEEVAAMLAQPSRLLAITRCRWVSGWPSVTLLPAVEAERPANSRPTVVGTARARA